MNQNQFYLESGKNKIAVQFITEKIVRISYNHDLDKTTPAIITKPDLSVNTQNNLQSSALKIEIAGDSLYTKIYDASGQLLLEDSQIDFEKLIISKKRSDETGYYGCGEHYTFINLLGQNIENWNTDVIGVAPLHSAIQPAYHTAINFYIGLSKDRVYGIYYDNSHRVNFDFSSDKVTFSAAGGSLDYYFISGNSVDEIVAEYTFLTGRAPLPRKDFLGYQQCRWSYETEDELLQVAHQMRAEKIPCDVLYLDIDYMQNFKVFTINSERFGNFRAMTKELQKLGFKLVVIIDPGVKQEQDYHVYEEGEEAGYFLKQPDGKTYIGKVWPGEAAFPDFNRDEVRTWWGRLHRDLLEAGVAGIWCDMNEPSDMSTDTKTVPEDVYGIDSFGELCTQKEFHNLYGFGQVQATYDGVRELTGKRPFVLTRAAFAGSQRYSAIWAGDNSSLWEHLETSIPMLLNMGLSGFAFAGCDVGGFMKNGKGELLARWMQLGALVPFFRNHTEKFSAHQEPWSFGEEITDICRKCINLRYSLISHFYNLFYHHSVSGAPIIRPLFYHYMDDENTHNISDQFMLGDSIIIAPILRPKAFKRLTYLPRGTWYEWEKSTPIRGGKYIVSSAELDEMPIYVKSGSIIPRDKIMNYVGEQKNELTLQIYGDGDCEYLFYSDDGISFNYQKGIYNLSKFSWQNNQLKIEKIQAQYELPNITIERF